MRAIKGRRLEEEPGGPTENVYGGVQTEGFGKNTPKVDFHQVGEDPRRHPVLAAKQVYYVVGGPMSKKKKNGQNVP